MATRAASSPRGTAGCGPIASRRGGSAAFPGGGVQQRCSTPRASGSSCVGPSSRGLRGSPRAAVGTAARALSSHSPPALSSRRVAQVPAREPQVEERLREELRQARTEQGASTERQKRLEEELRSLKGELWHLQRLGSLAERQQRLEAEFQSLQQGREDEVGRCQLLEKELARLQEELASKESRLRSLETRDVQANTSMLGGEDQAEPPALAPKVRDLVAALERRSASVSARGEAPPPWPGCRREASPRTSLGPAAASQFET